MTADRKADAREPTQWRAHERVAISPGSAGESLLIWTPTLALAVGAPRRLANVVCEESEWHSAGARSRASAISPRSQWCVHVVAHGQRASCSIPLGGDRLRGRWLYLWR